MADAWVGEVGGPFAPAARDALEAQGSSALAAVAQRWDLLAEDDRVWLLEWAARQDAGEASRLIGRVLEGGPEALIPIALRAAAGLPDGSVDSGLLGRWAQHEDAEIRAAAVEAGAAADPEFLLRDPGSAPELAAAAIRRLAEQRGAAAAEAIAARLGDERQEVRTAAREAIVGLGPNAIEPLRPLVKSGDAEIRAGAVRALLDLGDDEWLERELLS